MAIVIQDLADDRGGRLRKAEEPARGDLGGGRRAEDEDCWMKTAGLERLPMMIPFEAIIGKGLCMPLMFSR